MPSHTPPRLLRDCLVFFSQSIQDPTAPKHYSDSESPESGALTLNLRKDTSLEESHFIEAHTILYQAVLALLTVPRTSRALSAFMLRLSDCSCADIEVPLISYFHERGVERMEPLKLHKTTASMFIRDLFELLSSQLLEASAVRVAKGQGRSWPICVPDIIPFGPPALVTTVGQWMLVLEEPSMVLRFLTAALCGRPLFVAISTLPSFLKQFIISMQAACRRLEDGSQWRGQCPMLRFSNLLHAIMSCRTSQNSIMAWTRGHEAQLWRVFSATIRIMRSRERTTPTVDGEREIRQVTTSFQDLILQFSPEAIQPPWFHPELYQANQLWCRMGSSDDRRWLDNNRLEETAVLLRLRLPPFLHTFQKCSACNVTGYCSPAYQATDWKDKKFPHKVYCKKIKVFLGAAGKAKLDFDDAASFARKFDRKALPDGDTTLQDIADWSRTQRAEVEEWDLLRARTAISLNAPLEFNPSQIASSFGQRDENETSFAEEY
ncbi:hypothetical protein B0H19DRAFT_1071782 [Mycena capillaripes]|nr:hypothetical protein B0H19DRAFT_1071782 [Mycena capillaripes]